MPETFLHDERSSFRVQSRVDNDNDSSDSSSAESSESSSNTLTSSSDTLTRPGSPHVGGRPGVYIAVILLTCVTLFALAFQVFPHADSEAREYAFYDDLFKRHGHKIVSPCKHCQYDDNDVVIDIPDEYSKDLPVGPDGPMVIVPYKKPIDDDKWIQMFSNKLLQCFLQVFETAILCGALSLCLLWR